MSDRRRLSGLAPIVTVGLVLVLAVVPASHALETDQFWAWDRELADATDVVNTRINDRIDRTLARLNARRGGPPERCHDVSGMIADDFRRFLFQELIIWAAHSSLVETAPDDFDGQRRYRDEYLFHRTHPFDVGTKVPPSPTIEIAGVRFGTDKLSHFFSQGWRYHAGYERQRRRGASPEDAERRAMATGLRWEHTILGLLASGVLSIGDLEANYRGMLFYRSLCDGEAPALRRGVAGWHNTRPVDLRAYVTPEWDESWSVPIFRRGRWKKVRPVMLRYCGKLDDPAVVARRRSYAERERLTPTERMIDERVRRGKLPDPARFELSAICPDGDPARVTAGD